jgi:hypothetical protein
MLPVRRPVPSRRAGDGTWPLVQTSAGGRAGLTALTAAGGRAGPLARTSTHALRFHVVVSRSDIGAFLLGGAQVVDPAELLAARLLVGRRHLPATTPPAGARFVPAISGLLRIG